MINTRLPHNKNKRTLNPPIATSSLRPSGLGALCEEIEAQGVDREALLATIGLTAASLDDPLTQITLRQKIKFFQNLQRIAQDQGIGLLAGQRHRLQDFGIYGFALLSFTTLEKAIRFGLSHARLAGSIIERKLRIDGGVAVIEGHDIFELNSLLPPAADFSFSTMHRLISLVMPRPFHSLQLFLPVPAPAHADLYAQIFRCHIIFDAAVLEWHFDASQLCEPCLNASLLSERMYINVCEQMLQSLECEEPALVRSIRNEYLNCVAERSTPSADELARRLHLSERTLRRRLAELWINCQSIIDDSRCRLSKEMLGDFALSIDEVAARIGFSDAVSFRRAFKRWTDMTPTEYRRHLYSRSLLRR